MEFIQEKRSRSLVKATTFRVIILIADTVIIYLLTQSVDVTLWVLILTNIASTVLYFSHERVWNRVRWGRERIPSA